MRKKSGRVPHPFKNKIILSIVALLAAGSLAACSSSSSKAKTTTDSSSAQVAAKKARDEEAAKKKKAAAEKKKADDAEKKKAEEEAEKKKADEAVAKKKADEEAAAKAKASGAADALLALTYDGTNQTVDVNGGVPTFSADELSLAKGAWEDYGDLDQLNRVTKAQAMLNVAIQPTGERGDISSVTPTGWKNKKLKSGYLYNRSHLIGYALAGENANVKNLMTGTAQLNNPEMLRHEMDIKEYIERSKDNYVRYLVEPIFKGDELVARGVHMMAQSVKESDISFNVYIFNVQDGVTINYADGTSIVDNSAAAATTTPAAPAPAATTSGETQYVDANGNGLIKGSKNHIYHLPGTQYYDRTTSPAAMFKTVAEAEAAGYRAPK